jgi:hypothetical protein
MCRELPKARGLFPEVRQRGFGWCIPAGFEVLLHYFAIPFPTQDEMVEEYARQYGHQGYVNASRQPCQLVSPSVEELRNYGFPAANFDVFAAICNAMMPKDSLRAFYHPMDCENDLEDHLRGSLNAGDGMLLALKNPDSSCHVMPLIGYDGSNLTTYEPWTGTIETKDINQYALNKDCVILRRN